MCCSRIASGEAVANLILSEESRCIWVSSDARVAAIRQYRGWNINVHGNGVERLSGAISAWLGLVREQKT